MKYIPMSLDSNAQMAVHAAMIMAEREVLGRGWTIHYGLFAMDYSLWLAGGRLGAI